MSLSPQSLLGFGVCDALLGFELKELLPLTLAVRESSPVFCRTLPVSSSLYIRTGYPELTGGCYVTLLTGWRISDPCRDLEKWASGPMIPLRPGGWLPGLCPGLLLGAVLEPLWRRMVGVEARLQNPLAALGSSLTLLEKILCFKQARKKAKVSGAAVRAR